MPSEQPAASGADRLSVAFDATPLLIRPTGVGVFCAGALSALAPRPDLAMSAFAVSWRRRKGIDRLLPSGVASTQHPMPARPLHWAWGKTPHPSVDWFIGRHDVVHGSNFVVPPSRRAARVVSVHDLTVLLYPELCSPPTLAFPHLIRRAVAEGAWVQTPSQFVTDEVIAEFHVDPGRVRTVPYGVPPLPAPSGGAEMPLPVELPAGCTRYILAVGTIEPRKDYPLLLEAFTALAGDHRDVALVIVGDDGWGVDPFLAALGASPARARVLRPGYLDDGDLAVLLRNAAALAYPSVYEGFGFPPLQAMVAGVPVVTTAVGSIPEVVGDGALLVKSGDGDGLAGQLARVLDGGPDVDQLIDRGRRQSARFTWQACADGLADLYHQAAGEHRR